MAWNSTCSEKKNIGKETNRPKKFIYFLLRTEEYFAFYRTLNRVYSIIIDLIILNNYIGAQNIRVTGEVIFLQVTDPGTQVSDLTTQVSVFSLSFSGVCMVDTCYSGFVHSLFHVLSCQGINTVCFFGVYRITKIMYKYTIVSVIQYRSILYK